MGIVILNTVGLKCPQPVLKVAVKATTMSTGDIMEVRGDCPTFEKDLRVWCERLGRPMLAVQDEEGSKRIQIQF